MRTLNDLLGDLNDTGPDTPVDTRKPEYALAILLDIAMRAESETYVKGLAATVLAKLPDEDLYDTTITDAIFRNKPVLEESERQRIIQSNAVADIVFAQHKKAFPDLHPLLDFRYGVADALWQAGLRFRDPDLPLDPEPWVVRSMDSGDHRVSSDSPILGYRHNFEPREGYNQDRARYREVNDGRG